MICFGNVPAGSVLPIFFGSYGKTNGESITLSGLAVTDVEVYKGTSMTQRASDAGYALIDTDGIDVDSITGIHGFSIDTGDNTDSGFYSVGSFFTVVVSAVTIDSQVVNFVAATFRIVAAEANAGYPKADTQYIEGTDATDQIRDSVVDDATRIDASALNTASGTTIPSINTKIGTPSDLGGGATLSANNSDIAGAAFDTSTDSNEAIRNRGDTAWVTATGFATAAALATAQTDLDTITGSDGVTLATAQGNYAPAKAGDAMALTSNERNATADALLDRDMSTGTDNGSATVRTPRQALRILRNKRSVSGSTLTVTKEDDSTASWTAAITSNASAEPITEVDPASS